MTALFVCPPSFEQLGSLLLHYDLPKTFPCNAEKFPSTLTRRIDSRWLKTM